MATRAKTPRMISPAITFGERGSSARSHEATDPATGGSGAAVVPARVLTSVVTWSRLLPSAGVDQDVDPVRDEIREQHDQGDDHEDALYQRVVVAQHRLEQQVADARIAEDDLDEQLAGDDEADGEGEVGDGGQERVARRVPDDPSGPQALGAGHQDEVLVHGDDHHV